MLSKEQAKKLKILMVVEQCNPDWVSVPLVGYKFYREVNQLAEVTLVTHARNRKAFANCPQHHPVIFIEESQLNILYHKLAVRIAAKGRKDLAKGVNWPLYHLLAYPVYAEFNYKVYQRFKSEILSGHYDIVHALTPIMPRYPFKVCQLCKQTPFILGPVNGGIPFPAGFAEKAKQENSYLNFLRAVGRYLIPGYVATYKRADKVLSGSSYTLSLLKKLFRLPEQKMALFYENGIEADTLTTQPKSSKEGDEQINLLFVGRLVPYKCADVVIRAVNQLKASVKYRAQLTIVGDGSERETLKALVQSLGLDKQVQFTGFVPQATVSQYYGAADIFCFPSIREFGGAVVLEAMAHGLPCIVADYGGIGEYVTEEMGCKIEPKSRQYLIEQLRAGIELLVEDTALRQQMSVKAIERAQEFAWPQKAENMLQVYYEAIADKAQIKADLDSPSLVTCSTDVAQ